jgi:hypothetical protein
MWSSILIVSHLTFFNDYSHYGWVYLLKNKSDVFGMFQTFRTHVEKQFKNSIASFKMANVVNTLLRHSVIIANNTVSTNNLLNRKWWVE